MVAQVTTRRSFRRGAGPLLGLWATLAGFRTADGFTSALDGCLTETLLCTADDECATCLTNVQANGELPDENFAECIELFADVCRLVDVAGCDLTNERTEAFAVCLAAETFGCEGFTTCEDAVRDAPTPPPTATPVTTTGTPTTLAQPSTTEEGTSAPTAAPTAAATPAGTSGGTSAGTSGGTSAGTSGGTSAETNADGTEVDRASTGGASRTAVAAAGTALAIACGVALAIAV